MLNWSIANEIPEDDSFHPNPNNPKRDKQTYMIAKVLRI